MMWVSWVFFTSTTCQMPSQPLAQDVYAYGPTVCNHLSCCLQTSNSFLRSTTLTGTRGNQEKYDADDVGLVRVRFENDLPHAFESQPRAQHRPTVCITSLAA